MRLAWAVGVAFVFVGLVTATISTGGWAVSVGIALGIIVYNLAAIARRPSRRHVRIFTGAALVATRSELLALLAPVSTIARTKRALDTAAPAPADQELVDNALSEALLAVWQATDPASTRGEVDQIRTGLEQLAATTTGVLSAVADLTSATYLPIPDPVSDDAGADHQPHSSASRRVLSGLDQSTQAIADRVSAQASAAETLRQINQPSLPVAQDRPAGGRTT